MSQKYKWSRDEKARLLAEAPLSPEELRTEVARFEALQEEVQHLGKRINHKVTDSVPSLLPPGTHSQC